MSFVKKYPNTEKALKFMDYSYEHGWDEAIFKSGLNQSNLDKW